MLFLKAAAVVILTSKAVLVEPRLSASRLEVEERQLCKKDS